ncbi:hypothetical protein [Paludisphaera mucosa]|uniref:Lipoprotein n=1 Tax=Paludisphaera mucosa TaxID=3030827 RepID=A0ABT6FGC3_9BACT|nr:hypothetical protein [Paludisphaera mucosa]MDG3006631.1 hypothetical protein [Paludisphaera mucosa]
MSRIRYPFLRAFGGFALIASSSLLAATAGCSGDATAVAEGDAEARRRQKDESLKGMLDPGGSSEPAAGSRPRASRPKAGAARPGDSL